MRIKSKYPVNFQFHSANAISVSCKTIFSLLVKNLFFAFIPNTELCVESKNVFKNMLVETNGFSLVCPSEDIIAVLTRKSIHLRMLKIES